MEATIDSIRVREYIHDRREKLEHNKSNVDSGNARRSISSAISELMFVEEFLDDIDPIGRNIFLKKNKKSYK